MAANRKKPSGGQVRLQSRIHQSMLLVVVPAVLLSFAAVLLLSYRQTMSILEEDIRQEAEYLCAAMDIAGEEYLREIDIRPDQTRVTLIRSDGVVLYDSLEAGVVFENHLDRPEVAAALATGSGEDMRSSPSVNYQYYYYARLLADGNVLRVSKTVSSMHVIVLRFMPILLLLAAVLIALSWIIAGREARRLVAPINALDLDFPLENDVYPELSPLLLRIEKQIREREALGDMRKEFSANVSHELKTPLTVITGYAELLMNGLVKEGDVSSFSGNIYKEAQRMIALIDDIIRLSQLDENEGSLEPVKESCDLLAIAREVREHLNVQAEGRRISLTVSGTSASVSGIRQVLYEMIYNLVDNAIKYNRDGGYVKLTVESGEDAALVRCQDNGIGIPEKDRERIFERFYRVDKSRSRSRGGTGLGLSIVKHGALLHGAEIRVRSRIGEGTTMELIFPTCG